jgi:DNA polymerase epsilon subunit 1
MTRGKTFGLTSSGKGNKWTRGNSFNTRGRGGWRGRRRGRGEITNGVAATSNKANDAAADEGSLLEAKFENVQLRDEVDEKMGFPRVSEGPRREGWLVNMHPVS